MKANNSFNFQLSTFNLKIVALLFVGSATLLCSCKSNNTAIDDMLNPEAVVTQQTINHTLIQSLNGVRQSKMTTPLMERHDMAREQFMEFPNGIEITTYDSIGEPASTIKANYAIYYEKRRIWEARGNVVGNSVSEQRTLRTEQLFWDERMERIYSNVNTYVEQPDGIYFGQGFESDQELRQWEFHNYRGRFNFDPDELERSDTTAVQTVAPAVTPATPATQTTRAAQQQQQPSARRDGNNNRIVQRREIQQQNVGN